MLNRRISSKRISKDSDDRYHLLLAKFLFRMIWLEHLVHWNTTVRLNFLESDLTSVISMC